ncbi:MAG: hypothetical protein Q8K60_08980 [Parachlamydiaceae bacterium]|nr:hypothetical protein [Parachlamydiaceae bacterium]
MNNRTLFILTGVVLFGMIGLLALNLASIIKGRPPAQTYLKYNDVKGMAVGYHDLLYTLNFNQQNEVIDILNRSVRIVGLKPGKHQKPTIDKIVIYLFEHESPITVTPIAYIDQNLVYSVPEWNQDGYLMELSDGILHKLISQTYDP